MRRMLLALLLVPLFLSACGGGDTTVPDPPAATPFESSGSEQVDAVIADWRTAAWDAMAADGVKPETKEEKIFQSSATLTEVDSFYGQLTSNGWWRLQRMPGLTGDVLLAGYEQGTTALVIGAIDATKYGGEGTVIYTLKGTK
jgi:hypothetical protein